MSEFIDRKSCENRRINAQDLHEAVETATVSDLSRSGDGSLVCGADTNADEKTTLKSGAAPRQKTGVDRKENIQLFDTSVW